MSRRISGLAATLAVGALAIQGTAFAVDAPGSNELISTSTDEVQGNQDSQLPSISAHGRYVAFASHADNLVPEDTNVAVDVFVRDRLTGTTERVSVSDSERQGDGDSGILNLLGGPSISEDGRYVAFASESTNLVRGDRNDVADVFVRDRVDGTTTRVSVTSDGAEASGTEPSISADGQHVAFISVDEALGGTDLSDDVFVHDLQTGTTERISQAPDGSEGDGSSSSPILSRDGRFVYFNSFASNLVTGDNDTDQAVDTFLFDRDTDTMSAVSGPFTPGTTTFQHSTVGGMSGNGQFLTFSTAAAVDPADTNGFEDAYLFDSQNPGAAPVRVSVSDTEQQGDEFTFAGPVSADGRFVAMVSRASNFGGPANFRENVYLRDVTEGNTLLVSAAAPGGTNELDSIQPAMTPDASVVALSSRSELLGPENQDFFAYDIFVRDARPQADLAVTMTDSPDPVTARGQVTYTVTVQNSGPATATGVTLTDTLPVATFVSASPSQGSCVRGGKGKTDGTLTCSLGQLASGESATVFIVVSPSKAGSITNSAVVQSDQPDGNVTNNSATETTTVVSK
jgi:uncharacterized repeat protein (TIGR01451 family)